MLATEGWCYRIQGYGESSPKYETQILNPNMVHWESESILEVHGPNGCDMYMAWG